MSESNCQRMRLPHEGGCTVKSAKVQTSSLQCCLSAVAEFVGQLQQLLGE